MKYRQLLILIMGIWAGQIAIPYMFTNVIPKKIDYRTYYVEKAPGEPFKLANFENELGERGWELVEAIPDPDNRNQLICICKRQTILKWDRGGGDSGSK